MASPSLPELHFAGNCVMPLMTGSRVWANIASPRSARDGAQTIDGNKNEYSEVGGAIVQMFIKLEIFSMQRFGPFIQYQ